jgi:hypothetical protein
MDKDQIAIQDADEGYHRYALHSILADFVERFDMKTLEKALNESLPQFHLKVISDA